MAYTKIIAIHGSINSTIKYARNEEKTSLEKTIDYAMNRSKTEKTCFESAINCRIDHAYSDMIATKKRWKKPQRTQTGKKHVQGYHIIQSFKPSETDPHTAHEIGCKFAQQCFGDQYEVVVTTHLDQNHLHNHVVINSVSFMDGRMYRNNFKDYFHDIRGISDSLCHEYGLSVIENTGHSESMHYAQWRAKKEGKPDSLTVLRCDIDAALEDCTSIKQFIARMRKNGYTVRYENRTHISMIPPGWKKPIRLTEKRLGANYSKEAIIERIRSNIQLTDNGHSVADSLDNIRNARNLNQEAKPAAQQFVVRKMVYRNPQPIWSFRIKGLRSVYIRYMYMFGIALRKNNYDPKISYYLRAQHWKLEKTKKEMHFIAEHNLHDIEQLHALDKSLLSNIEELSQDRCELHAQKRGKSDEEYAKLCEQTDALTEKIRILRRDHKMCLAIEQNSVEYHNDLRTLRDNIRTIEKAKNAYKAYDAQPWYNE